MTVTQQRMLGIVTPHKIQRSAISRRPLGVADAQVIEAVFSFDDLAQGRTVTVKRQQTVQAVAVARLPASQLDAMIDWKFMSPAIKGDQFAEIKGNIARSTGMPQEQWTIEVRATFDEPEKQEAMERIVRQAGRHILANAALLGGQVKPQIACYSDNFFGGHKDIDVLADDVGKGGEQLVEAGMDTAEPARVDPDLIAALRED